MTTAHEPSIAGVIRPPPVGGLGGHVRTDEQAFAATLWCRQLSKPRQLHAEPVTRCSGGFFAGGLAALATLRVKASGTPFQTKVGEQLRLIPAGSTISYAELARRGGSPTATRAVGAANGANFINIVIPCHRVIGSDVSLTGYGSGLPRKRWLLDHENGAKPLFASEAGIFTKWEDGTCGPEG
ncbi:MAG: methylated-DNA--[protein]-cysteine S-methyltransferase [Proteobacteria bacterium]|uniref:methylated-DNA--[protein]-cysteine S-methyltransferase n=1 Tax=Shinella sp. JR1-6 TaxID=2527671 RepID=UPI001404DF5C|nr:methylated-DNA--[protein]-cysteine S-methyltransferase [Shinella sp. JR1-6]MCA0344795.1 methylated-DNA--[protein]-cysteine S-methyltransferase [Pseudomonadota bacterium]